MGAPRPAFGDVGSTRSTPGRKEADATAPEGNVGDLIGPSLRRFSSECRLAGSGETRIPFGNDKTKGATSERRALDLRACPQGLGFPIYLRHPSTLLRTGSEAVPLTAQDTRIEPDVIKVSSEDAAAAFALHPSRIYVSVITACSRAVRASASRVVIPVVGMGSPTTTRSGRGLRW